MRRLEVDRFGGRTRLHHWLQAPQGAHCRSHRAHRPFDVVIEHAGAAAYSLGSQAHLYSMVRGCVVHILLFSFLVEDHCCALDFCSYRHHVQAKGDRS